MKFYLGDTSIFKLRSIFYWKGKKYKIVNTNIKSPQDNFQNSDKVAIGVKIIDNSFSNS